jgi:hypothetical protein
MRFGRKRSRWLILPVWLATTTALALDAPAVEAEAGATPKAMQEEVAPEGSEEDARALLQRMAEHLAAAERLTVTLDIAYDAVQRDGQKLEFGETRRVALVRPDRLRIDAVRRDGERRGLVYDGKQIAAFDLDQKVYASVPKEGSLDEALDYMVNDLQLRVPLSELFSGRLVQTLSERLDEVSYVEASSVGGATCDHVAGRGDEVDVQAWVQQGDQPLPRRVVITYRDARGEPQFRADLRDWDLAPALDDAIFSFTPAPDAERVPVAAPAAAGAAAGAAQPAAGSAP